jgi:phage-related protein
MPKTKVVFYREDEETVPVLQWMNELEKTNKKKILAKSVERIQRLGELGHEMRRPHADFLRDGIYELRLRDGNVQPRILYFFHGKNVAILAHSLSNKSGKVPTSDVKIALARKAKFEKDEKRHTHEE